MYFADRPSRQRWRGTFSSLAAVPLILLAVALGNAATAGARPNVLVITLDTTRADHLGCYGYTRPTSPHLDKLCEHSQVYTRGFSTSSWTLPAHASLFTGKFSSSHGVTYAADGPLSLSDGISGPSDWRQFSVRPLEAAETTLAEILQREGYRTGAVVAGPWMKKLFGLAQGFSSYDEERITDQDGRRAKSVTGAAIHFLDQADPEHPAPFFLFLNYYDPHSPYSPKKDFARSFVRALPGGVREDPDWRKTALYDAEIAYMDEQIGRLFARLRKLGVYDDTLIVVTADHGELLGEHGEWGHGYHLYQEEIRIPFILKPAAGADADSPKRIDTAVQLVDVLPLILNRLGIPLPQDIQGTPPGEGAHPIVAEVYPHHSDRWVGDWRVSIRGTSKLVCNSLKKHLLFDLTSDPGEATNLIDSQPPDEASNCDALLRYLEGLPKRPRSQPPLTVDEETRKALESLGYLE